MMKYSFQIWRNDQSVSSVEFSACSDITIERFCITQCQRSHFHIGALEEENEQLIVGNS